MTPVEVVEGNSPIILAIPHTGTWLPDQVSRRLNDLGRELADTDWHIHKLYAGLLSDASIVRATFHRYLIDPNRAPSDASLYPGQNTTSLCPIIDFNGNDIWIEGAKPDSGEVAQRLVLYHDPYHQALSEQIERIKSDHGCAVLYDCHSIRSKIPFLFEGRLPDFNLGTNDGLSCSPALEAAAVEICGLAEGFSSTINARFKGGWTTRNYGKPADGVHAFQMELAQSTYMLEHAPWTCRADRANEIRVHLKVLLERFAHIAVSGAL